MNISELTAFHPSNWKVLTSELLSLLSLLHNPSWNLMPKNLCTYTVLEFPVCVFPTKLLSCSPLTDMLKLAEHGP